MFVPVEQLAGKSIGQYKLTKLIGRSVLSAVYEAASSEQASPVMLTVFRLPDDCVGEAWELFMERFEDEAARLRVLQHPHIVPYYEFGEEFGYPYLITPLTSNQTLVDILKQSVCTPVQMLHLLKQIATGLDYIHSNGIVHGSLKPSNILLRAESSQPRVLIANVGLTQILEMRGIGEVSHSHPHLFSVSGTLLTNPAYLAPEVVQGAPSDVRSDMYALGILIYEMLCGRPPFTGSDPIAVALQHVDQPIPPMQSFVPELPQALDGALRSVLERDPARRILQAEKLVASLERIIKTLQESNTANTGTQVRQSGMMGKGSLVPHSARVEQQWQGMPGVTGDKMPSLVPEFMAGAGGATKRSARGQFKLPSSGSLPPIPPASVAAGKPETTLNPGRMFKPPMAPVSESLAPAPSAARPSPGAPLFKSAQPARVSPPVQQADQPLVTVIASGPQAKQILPTMQSVAIQNASPFAAHAAPMAANAYGSQMAGGQQYSPVQASPLQMSMNAAVQAGAQQYSPVQAPPLQMPVNAAVQAGYTDPRYAQQQAGGVYADPQYGQQQVGGMYDNAYYAQQQAGGVYAGPQYAQPQYMDQYGQGGQGAWAQHEMALEPGPDKGRRRAAMIVGGAVVAAVLGAGGISLLRMMKDQNNATNATPTNNSQTQAPPAATGQQNTAQTGTTPADKKTGPVIADQKKLAVNTAQDFTNPIDNHPSILVHLPNGKFAAYDKACTHQGVSVAYDPQTNKLVCPLHHSIFDPADNGKVLQGPAFLRLPAVQIQINGDGTITVGQ